MGNPELFVYTVVLSNPNATSNTQSRYDALRPASSMSYLQTIGTSTLLSNPNSISSQYQGLLYFPGTSPPCTPNSTDIPINGTSLEDLPDGFNLIAIFPFDNCLQSYLNQARLDGVVSALVYNYSSTQGSSTPSGELSTLTSFNFPIYGISSMDSPALLQNLVNYHGNMTTVPNATALETMFNPASYVRLAMEIDTGQTSSLPGLWLFLLVILGALALVITSTSLSMHYSQHRARRDLRRRIANGEIDLEALGIKRLTVPQSRVDELPLKTYMAREDANQNEAKRELDDSHENDEMHENKGNDGNDGKHDDPESLEEHENKDNQDNQDNQEIQNEGQSSDHEPNSVLDSNQDTAVPKHSFDTSTCAICLDDFVSGETQVRELPCYHAFHPECIDNFLVTRSSLCPLCKRSVLPKGFIPDNLTITNATIARERRLRQLRSRGIVTTPTGMALSLEPDGSIALRDHPRRTEGYLPQDPLQQTNPLETPAAPTDEDEHEAMRRRGWFRRTLDSVFPRFAHHDVESHRV